MNNILKSLRKAASLTQEAVTDSLGVTVNTIQNWKRTNRLAKESLHELIDFYTHIGFDDAEEELRKLKEFRKVQLEIEKKNKKPMSQKMFKVV